jgi:hypothetical protein
MQTELADKWGQIKQLQTQWQCQNFLWHSIKTTQP